MACRVIETRRTTASNCMEMRGAAASSCMALRGTVACKCPEPRLAWECDLCGRPRTEARVHGTRVESVRKMRLKCVSGAWNRGSTYW